MPIFFLFFSAQESCGVTVQHWELQSDSFSMSQARSFCNSLLTHDYCSLAISFSTASRPNTSPTASH
jgi:hypothetical protein